MTHPNPCPLSQAPAESCIGSAIGRYVREQMPESPDRQLVAGWLTEFVLTATVKFAKGYIEHGGSILDSSRSLSQAILEEQIDTFFYVKAQQEKIKNLTGIYGGL